MKLFRPRAACSCARTREGTLSETVKDGPEVTGQPVLVLDFGTLACEETTASKFNKSGCEIRSGKLTEIGQLVGIRLADMEQMIKGRVEKVEDGSVYVSFKVEDKSQVEKRREPRKSVSIPAWVSGHKSDDGVRCDIVDASKSGCRLSSTGLEVLPENIKLQIAGLDMPVKGEIVWRNSSFAGVKLTWQFANDGDNTETRIKPPDLAGKAGVKDKAKSNSSGFGVKRRKGPD